MVGEDEVRDCVKKCISISTGTCTSPWDGMAWIQELWGSWLVSLQGHAYHIWKIMLIAWGPQCQEERKMSHPPPRKARRRIFLNKKLANRTIPSIWYSWGGIWRIVSTLHEGIQQRITRMIWGTWHGRRHWDNKVCLASKREGEGES